MSVTLTETDRALLGGELGEGTAMAMRIVVKTAEAVAARHLVDIEMAHIDGCLNHGQVSLDFIERLVHGGARVAVPTSLNVGSLDLLHPDLVRSDDAATSRRIMDAYVELGAMPTWTCAPYQGVPRPRLGAQIAWAESNAIVFANSVIGARTERYGDFIDACAAVTGRVPHFGLHTDEGRRPGLVVTLDELSFEDETSYPLAGMVLGRKAGSCVPVLAGLPPNATEDDLKALGAAAASSGSLAMFHAVGVTPEAPSEEELAGLPSIRISPPELSAARDLLTNGDASVVDAVSLGGPHYSVRQLARLIELVRGRTPRLPLYVNASRATVGQLTIGQREELERSGVTLVTDTCTYLAPIMGESVGTVMTDSAKWAYYAPANLGVDVVFASVGECVETAFSGGGDG